MGISDRKEREKEEMRRRILESAKKLFLDLGYEKTSIRGIAEDIEYSPATIYLYFKDKNELLFALHQEAFVEFAKTFVKVAHIADPFERLITLGREYLAFAFANPELYELMFLLTAPMEALEIREDVWEDGRSVYMALEMLIAECQAAGHFKGADVQQLSMMIWATVHGLVTIQLRKRCTMFDENERDSRIQGGLDSLIRMLESY
ncbi:MAG: TetR/AcrR family transcriptional regulator [Leadbetterella sp.]|nr:TetR/AcrR family transcriptional regulator [Leadbetterella sp.]